MREKIERMTCDRCGAVKEVLEGENFQPSDERARKVVEAMGWEEICQGCCDQLDGIVVGERIKLVPKKKEAEAGEEADPE